MTPAIPTPAPATMPSVAPSPRWWRPRSLRGQLLIWLIPLHLVAALVAGALSYRSYSTLFHTFMDEQMAVLATSFSATDIEHLPTLAPLSDGNVHEWGAFAVQLWGPDGTLLASSRPSAGVGLQNKPGHRYVASEYNSAEVWRVYTAAPGPRASQPRVQVLQSQEFQRQEVGVRTLYTFLPAAVVAPLMLFILWLLVARTSRALRALAGDVAMLSDQHLAPVPDGRVPDEIAPLVRSFNHLLGRLRDSFAVQRRFVQDAAHELRTPMTALALQMENLRPALSQGPHSQDFAQLESGMRRVHHLIEQLLRLSRQEAPPAHGPAPPVVLMQLLRDSVGQLMPLADRRRVEVSVEGDVPALLHASATDLRSVIDNLLDNAVRYSPEGGEVVVQVHARPPLCWIDVVDSGPGIAPELRERVFDRFFRAPGNAAHGSGLGLAIARAAAARHGLRLELRARDDGHTGLVARVHLPPHSMQAPR